VYAAQNQVDKTVGAFKKAIEVKPKFAEAHFNLGMVYFAIGKKNQASEEYRVLATLDQRLAKKLKDSIEK
jgi:tetratricopeptide (TPR) repeat protein